MIRYIKLVTIVFLNILILSACDSIYEIKPKNSSLLKETSLPKVTTSSTPNPSAPISLPVEETEKPTPTKEKVTLDLDYAKSLPTKSYRGTPNTEGQTIIAKYGGFHKKNKEKSIYLTYNLGFEYGYTDELLDVLKEKNIKASFFPLGTYIANKSNLAIVKRIVNEGHTLGSHGYLHEDQTNPDKWTVEKIIKDFEDMQNILLNTLGSGFDLKYFRPPYGYFSERVLYLAEISGYTSVFWTFAYNDWGVKKEGTESVLNRYMSHLEEGMILQLHISNRDNIDVLDKFIDEARSLGYEFYSLND